MSAGTSNTACVGAVTVPIASRLILPAADRYASISAGDIVSAPAMLSKPWVESSAGRNLRGVDFEREQIANRVRVFGAVQAVEAGRGQMRGRAAIELALHPADQRLERGRIRPPHAGRRHHAGAQLADDFFADLRVVAEVREIELVEQQVRRLQPRVVAGHTVLVDQRALRGGVRRGGGGGSSRPAPAARLAPGRRRSRPALAGCARADQTAPETRATDMTATPARDE